MKNRRGALTRSPAVSTLVPRLPLRLLAKDLFVSRGFPKLAGQTQQN